MKLKLNKTVSIFMKSNLFNFIIFALCLNVVIACSTNKFNGVYVGTLTSSETKRRAADNSVLETTGDEEKNLIVILKQDGNEVFVSITGSRLLGECSLRARIDKKNGAAYVDRPQLCSNSLSLTGSFSVGSDELIMSLGGFTQYSDQSYRFRGLSKK